MNGADGSVAQHFVQDVQRRIIAVGLKCVNSPDKSSVVDNGSFQTLLVVRGQTAQQGQELPIQLANRALVDENSALLELTLDFDQLSLIMLVPPANECQNIKTVGAVRQADRQDSTGLVGRTRMGTGGIHAAVALAYDKDRPIQGLDVLLDRPCTPQRQRLATMQTGVAVTRDDQPGSVSKLAGWAMARLCHERPPLGIQAFRHMLLAPVTARQTGHFHGSAGRATIPR